MKLTSKSFGLVLAGFGLSLLTFFAATSASASLDSVKPKKPEMQEKLSCADWNKQEFAEKAKPSFVAGCLEAERKVNERDEEGRTLLHRVSKVIGKSNVVMALIKRGADPHTRDKKGRVPLHYAGGAMNELATALLLMGNSDANAKDDEGKTPLHHLSNGYRNYLDNQSEIPVRSFLKVRPYKGHNQKEWFNDLMKVNTGNFNKTFQVLVEAGADFREKDHEDKSFCDRMEVIKAFLKRSWRYWDRLSSIKNIGPYGLYYHDNWWDWPLLRQSELAGKGRALYVLYFPEVMKACGGKDAFYLYDAPRSQKPRASPPASSGGNSSP